MDTYKFSTDAVTVEIAADGLDEACVKFADDQGWDNIDDIHDLTERVESMDGLINIYDADGVPYYVTHPVA